MISETTSKLSSLRTQLRMLILDVLVLFTLSTPCVLLFLFCGNPANASPYLSEVASHTANEWQFLRYVLLVSAYAILLECVLRTLQSSLRKHLSAWALILLMAVLYGATHFKFHLMGFLYATSVGAITAYFFHRTKRVSSLVVWHVGWELLAIGYVIVNGVLSSGACRTALLFEYKSQQVQAGDLTNVDDWGWVDKSHLVSSKIERMTETLYEKRGQTLRIDFDHGLQRMFRSNACTSQTFRFAIPSDATIETCHAMAASAQIQASMRHENDQSQEFVFFGMPLSAYSFEDLSTVLYSIYVTRPNASRDWERRSAPSIADDLAQWNIEGRSLVNLRVRDPASFTPLNQEVADSLTKELEEIRQASVWVTRELN